MTKQHQCSILISTNTSFVNSFHRDTPPYHVTDGLNLHVCRPWGGKTMLSSKISIIFHPLEIT